MTTNRQDGRWFFLLICCALQVSGCTFRATYQETCSEGTPPPRGQEEGASTVMQITAGNAHTCALLKSGMVKCWGRNEAGQVISGGTDPSPRPTPTQVPDIAYAIQIAAGGIYDFGHTCALLDGGGVKCWGQNDEGQRGDGTRESGGPPGCVSGLMDAQEVSLGYKHTCARIADGSVRCWGFNMAGQLGDSTQEGKVEPSAVLGDLNGGVAQIEMGMLHSCALLRSGQVRCWGLNNSGQLGDDMASGQFSKLPVLVRGIEDPHPPANPLENVTQISAGYEHTCAVLRDGRVMCWGRNNHGQLGDGTQEQRSTPVLVPGLGGVRQIDLGAYHGCALLADGTVRCWGRNDWDQLGYRTNKNQSSAAMQVTGLSDVSQIALGSHHSCVLVRGGQIKCWGRNEHGQLGVGSAGGNFVEPVTVRWE